jgi:putative membrane protein
MGRLAKSLVIFVIAFHLVVFVVEAFLWMRIYEVALPHFGSAIAPGLREQALILKPAFVNQGFYNLFLAAAGILGFVLLGRGNRQAGITLIAYMCACAAAAGVVLACTTSAYVGAVLQALPALATLIVLRRGVAPATVARKSV